TSSCASWPAARSPERTSPPRPRRWSPRCPDGRYNIETMERGAIAAPGPETEVRPPVASMRPKVDVVHGDRRVDDYFWLRDKADPEVAAYLRAENAYTDAVMSPTAALQEDLYREMLGRIQETDLSVPYREGGYFYYSRTEEGKQYAILCRKRADPVSADSLRASEEITLDLNTLAEGRPYFSLGAYAVSDDGGLLAYSTDVTGFRE